MMCCSCEMNPWLKVLHVIALLLLIFGLWSHKVWLIIVIVLVSIICHLIKKKPVEKQVVKVKKRRR